MQVFQSGLTLGRREGPGRCWSRQEEPRFFLSVEGGTGHSKGRTGGLKAHLLAEELNPAVQSGPLLGVSGPSPSNSATFF